MKYKVYQTYTQTDVQEVEADSEKEAMSMCEDGDGWQDFDTSDYSMFAEEGELFIWENIEYIKQWLPMHGVR